MLYTFFILIPIVFLCCSENINTNLEEVNQFSQRLLKAKPSDCRQRENAVIARKNNVHIIVERWQGVQQVPSLVVVVVGDFSAFKQWWGWHPSQEKLDFVVFCIYFLVTWSSFASDNPVTQLFSTRSQCCRKLFDSNDNLGVNNCLSIFCSRVIILMVVSLATLPTCGKGGCKWRN